MATRTVANLTAVISANNTKFKKGINGAKSSMGGFQKSIAAVGPAIAAAFSVNAIKNFVTSTLDFYDAQAKEEQKLLTALDNRVDVQKRLIQQAKELQKTTLFGDEETIKAQSLLATMGLTEQQIVDLVPLVQDMSVALGMDLAGAASLVGKSVATSTDALARYFDTGLKGVVGMSERAAKLTEALSEKMKGQAEAAAEAGTGVRTQFTNIKNDLKEQVGESILVLTGLEEKLKSFNVTLADVDIAGTVKEYVAWREENEKLDKTIRRTLNPFMLMVDLNKKQLGILGNMIDKRKRLNGEDNEFFEIAKHGVGVLEELEEVEDGLNEKTGLLVDTTGDLNAVMLRTSDIIDINKESIEGWLQGIQDSIDETQALEDAMDDIAFGGDEEFLSDDEGMRLANNFKMIKKEGKSMSDTLVVAFSNIGSSFAKSLGEVAAGTQTLAETLSEISTLIIDSLGDILIMAGVKAGFTPQGIGLILGGVALKGLSSYITASRTTDSTPKMLNNGKGINSNNFTIRGNDLVTAYDNNTTLNQRLY